MTQWLNHFRLEQFHIVNGDRLISDPAAEIRKVETFLGLKHSFPEESIYFDKDKGFYCAASDREGVGGCLGSSKGQQYPDIDTDLIQKLRHYYQPHNDKFFQLVEHGFEW